MMSHNLFSYHHPLWKMRHREARVPREAQIIATGRRFTAVTCLPVLVMKQLWMLPDNAAAFNKAQECIHVWEWFTAPSPLPPPSPEPVLLIHVLPYRFLQASQQPELGWVINNTAPGSLRALTLLDGAFISFLAFFQFCPKFKGTGRSGRQEWLLCFTLLTTMGSVWA